MVYFIIGIMFGFIFGWLYWFSRAAQRVQRPAPEQVAPRSYRLPASVSRPALAADSVAGGEDDRYYRERALQDAVALQATQLDDLKSRLEALNQHQDTRKSEVNHLRSQLDNARKNLAERDDSIARLQGELKQLRAGSGAASQTAGRTGDGVTTRRRQQAPRPPAAGTDVESLKTQLAGLRSGAQTATDAHDGASVSGAAVTARHQSGGMSTAQRLDLMARLPQATTDPDDLKAIKGLGFSAEGMLRELGIVTYRQLALLSESQQREVAIALKMAPEAIVESDWIEQAQTLYTEKYQQPL